MSDILEEKPGDEPEIENPTEQREATCEKHGAFVSRYVQFLERWTDCPQCLERPETCPKHGTFVSKHDVFDEYDWWSGCPTCDWERDWEEETRPEAPTPASAPGALAVAATIKGVQGRRVNVHTEPLIPVTPAQNADPHLDQVAGQLGVSKAWVRDHATRRKSKRRYRDAPTPPWTSFERVDSGNNTRETWRNSRYLVSVDRPAAESADIPVIHLQIESLDHRAIHDWRDLQRIKNAVLGEEEEALELYPAESRLLDASNAYHLWCIPFSLPFGFWKRLVSETACSTGEQRPWDPDVRPSDLVEIKGLDHIYTLLRELLEDPEDITSGLDILERTRREIEKKCWSPQAPTVEGNATEDQL